MIEPRPTDIAATFASRQHAAGMNRADRLRSTGSRPALARPHRGAFAAAALLAWLLPAAAALAQSGDQNTRDAVNTAVDVVAAAGSVAGVSVGQLEKDIIKELVTCAVSGAKVARCGRDAVVARIPREARPFVNCMLDEPNPVKCGKQVAVANLPKETRAISQCVLDGTKVETCIKQEAVRQLPAQTQPIAQCVLDGTAVTTCAGRELIKNLPNEVKGAANCVASGTPVEQCAVQEAINRSPSPEARAVLDCVARTKKFDDCAFGEANWMLPPEAKDFAECARRTKSVDQCAADAAAKQFPGETRAIAECVARTRGDAETCAGEEARRRLPPGVEAVSQCISDRNDFGRCAAQAAGGSEQKRILDLIDKLKADGRSELGANDNGAMRNIIMIAEGIKNDDWDMVLLGGGTEIMKAAGKIILKKLLPPLMPLGVVVDPIVDVIVQSRADVIARVIKAAKAGDVSAIGEVIAEAYLMQNFIVPCALPIIPEQVRIAVCGPIGKVIREVAGVAGDVIDVGIDIIKDPLDAPGIAWHAVAGAVDGIFGGDRPQCLAPPASYKAHHGKCLGYAVYLEKLSPGRGLQSQLASLNNRCRNHYVNCGIRSDKLGGLCNPQNDRFQREVGQLSAAVDQGAGLYVRGFDQFARERLRLRSEARCDVGTFLRDAVPTFVSDCASAMNAQLPITYDPYCRFGAPGSISPPDVHRAACQQALDRVNPRAIAQRWCREPPLPSAVLQVLRPPTGLPTRPELLQPGVPSSSAAFQPPPVGLPGVLRPGAPGGVATRPEPQPISAPPTGGTGTGGRDTVSAGSNATNRDLCPDGQPRLPGKRCPPATATPAPDLCPDGQPRPQGKRCPPATATPAPDLCPDGQPRLPGRRCPPPGATQARSGPCPVNFIRVDGVCRLAGAAGVQNCNGRIIPRTDPCPAPSSGQATSPPAACGPGRVQINGVCRIGTRCPDGSFAPGRRACAGPAPTPVGPTPNKTCPDGSRVPATAACPAPTKACPDGSRVPATANCPNPTKVCPNGTRVPVTAQCPTPPQPRNCGPGYRALDKPNRYGAFCELIPKPQAPAQRPQAPVVTGPPPAAPPPQNCRIERVCAQFRPIPGSIAGQCVRFEQKRVCGTGAQPK